MNKRTIAILFGFTLFVIIILIVWFTSQKDIESSNNFATESTNTSTTQPASDSISLEEIKEETSLSILDAETKTNTEKQANNIKEPDSFERATYVAETQKPTYSIEEIESLAWKSFALSIDNVEYKFPCSVTEFDKIGYKMSKQFANQKLGYGYTDTPQFVNGKNYFTVYVVNNSDITLNCSDCNAFGIEINLDNISDNLELKVGDFKLSKDTNSTNLKSNFGVPTSETYTPEGIKILSYESVHNDANSWCFSFVNDKLLIIVLQGDVNV